jgi:hypothetical protein
MPKRPEFIKFMTKQLGEPSSRGFENVVFNTASESDDEESAPKNDLDV